MEKQLQTRFDNLKKRMDQAGIQLAVIMKPENVFYYSGFNPILNSHKTFVIVPMEGEPCLLVHCIRGDHAREEAWLQNIKYHGKWGDKVPVDVDPIKAIASIANDMQNNILKVGLELAFLPFQLCQDLISALGQPSSHNISDYIEEFKMIKDDHEIDLIRKSAELADRGMEVLIESLRNGLSEAEACTEGQYAMRKLWQEKYVQYEVSGFGGQEGGIIDAMNCWSLTGPRIAYGCDCPTDQRPKPGQLLLPMVWAKLGGYHAENERSVYVDHLDDFKMKAFTSMLKAREQVFKTIKPGVAYEDLYLAAVKVYEDNGFGQILPGRIGHGIGLSAHEFPSIKKGNKIKLQKGMILTVEPGIMSVEWGGVRHSDTVLITETGYEILTKTENQLIRV